MFRSQGADARSLPAFDSQRKLPRSGCDVLGLEGYRDGGCCGQVPAGPQVGGLAVAIPAGTAAIRSNWLVGRARQGDGFSNRRIRSGITSSLRSAATSVFVTSSIAAIHPALPSFSSLSSSRLRPFVQPRIGASASMLADRESRVNSLRRWPFLALLAGTGGERRTHRLGEKVRASESERAEWHARARSAGLTLSDLVRRAVGRARMWTPGNSSSASATRWRAARTRRGSFGQSSSCGVSGGHSQVRAQVHLWGDRVGAGGPTDRRTDRCGTGHLREDGLGGAGVRPLRMDSGAAARTRPPRECERPIATRRQQAQPNRPAPHASDSRSPASPAIFCVRRHHGDHVFREPRSRPIHRPGPVQ